MAEAPSSVPTVGPFSVADKAEFPRLLDLTVGVKGSRKTPGLFWRWSARQSLRSFACSGFDGPPDRLAAVRDLMGGGRRDPVGREQLGVRPVDTGTYAAHQPRGLIPGLSHL